MGWPQGARYWSESQIRKDADLAKALFRKRRFQEPKEQYLKAFAQLEQANKKVIALLPQILSVQLIPSLLRRWFRTNICSQRFGILALLQSQQMI